MAQVSSTQPPPKHQAPNSSPKEDKQLAKTWFMIFEDPPTSKNQKADAFWQHILADFNKFTPGPQHVTSSLSTRYISFFSIHSHLPIFYNILIISHRRKSLQNACLMFSAIYQCILDNPASGCAPKVRMNGAQELYQNKEGEYFT